MREIGGYIEFEHYNGQILHEDAIALNSGRNCLAYLIRAKKIKKIWLPYFLCDSVKKVCEREAVEINYYRINEKFLPENISLADDEWIYVVNYYGQLTDDEIEKLKNKYTRIVVDYAQAYFQMPIKGVDTLYTCRKYFGVTDGAFLYTDVILEEEIETDFSYDRMQFLLGRFEKTASEFYEEYSLNNKMFVSETIKHMSKLTKNLLRGIDYSNVKERRTNNFAFLHEELGALNRIPIKLVDGAFMYPFYCENASEVRKELQKRKIYIPTLWPNVLSDVKATDLEYLYAHNILPLPVDQRYDKSDMKYLTEVIKDVLFKRT